MIFFLFKVVYFDQQNFNLKFIFVCRYRKTSIKNSWITENIRYGGRVSLRQAAMGLANRLRRFTSSHAACNRHCRASQSLNFGPGKLINSTLFAAGGTLHTLETGLWSRSRWSRMFSAGVGVGFQNCWSRSRFFKTAGVGSRSRCRFFKIAGVRFSKLLESESVFQNCWSRESESVFQNCWSRSLESES